MKHKAHIGRMRLNHLPGKPHVPITCDWRECLLSRIDLNGIYLWCDDCREQHFVTWEQLEAWREAVKQILASLSL